MVPIPNQIKYEKRRPIGLLHHKSMLDRSIMFPLVEQYTHHFPVV